MILESVFFFWPVHSIQSCGGWVYGNYATLASVPHRELMKRGRIRFGRRIKGKIPEPNEAQIRKSLLIHENLGSALGGAILRETYVLDLEKYTSPTIKVEKERVEKALLALLNLKHRSTEGAIDYIGRYGEFDLVDVSSDALKHANAPAEVQEFCSKEGRKLGDPFVLALDEFWKVRKDILGLWTLAEGLRREDAEAVRIECCKRRAQSTFRGDPAWLALGEAILDADLSASLNQSRAFSRFILSRRDGEPHALTVCDTVRTSLYFMLLENVLSGTEHRQCLRCKKHFVVTVRTKQFCSHACQNSANVQKWREKQKLKSRSISLRKSRLSTTRGG
jgi:hypothetical protein